MLVPSCRHRPRDLECWHDLERCDKLHAGTDAFKRRVDQAIKDLALFTDSGKCYCGTSWGKDSVVVAHLLWTVCRSVPLMHLSPTNHNPDCNTVRDAYFSVFPGQDYTEVKVSYDGIDRINQPHDVVDKLTDQKWYQAIRRYNKDNNHRRHILGIRGEESGGRRMRMLKWGVSSPKACAPIGYWSTQDVFAYLHSRSLPVHPAYAMLGGGRWDRDKLRVAEIGDTHGTGGGRTEWEQEYYGDILRRAITCS